VGTVRGGIHSQLLPALTSPAFLAALHHRDAASGRGQHIDLALLDAQIAAQIGEAAYLTRRDEPKETVVAPSHVDEAVRDAGGTRRLA
jgi:crotonobetainyl-CoA:carnitine CoA-transferase CaiB-like acyl-CoA transferase